MGRMAKVRFALSVVSVILAALEGHSLRAQPPAIPTIQPGKISVELGEFTSGLPVVHYKVSEVFTQTVGPTDMEPVVGRDDLLAVTFYNGHVELVDRQGRRNATPFLDLMQPDSPTFNPRFTIGRAHGLVSIAFHPSFAEAEMPGYGKFYVVETEAPLSRPADLSKSITTGADHDDVLYEYQLSSHLASTCDVICAGTKREVLRVLQPGYHHNLGDLLFDSDQNLLIASGDGSTSSTTEPIMSHNAQDLTSPFGKVLRLNPLGSNSANGQYGIPESNPYRDGAGPLVDEIMAYGLRNPHRLTLDRKADVVYAAEVGERSVESVERIEVGRNYGWDRLEGNFLYDPETKTIALDADEDANGRGDFAQTHDFTPPIFEYPRQPGNAVIGGVVYRGSRIPELQGQYVFADLTARRLMYGNPEDGQVYSLGLLSQSEAIPTLVFGVNADAAGELYVLGAQLGAEGTWGSVLLKLYPQLASDLDADHDVDSHDLLLFVDHWTGDRRGNPAPESLLGDTDTDGDVDSVDLMSLIEEWTGHLGEPVRQLGNVNAQSLATPREERLTLIPEPTGLYSWLVLGGGFCLGSRRRLLV